MIKRILDLIDSSGLSDSAMCKELNLGNGIIGKWRKGLQKPSTDAIIKLSSYFKVSTDYLLLGTDVTTFHYSEEDQEWLRLIHQLPDDAKLEFKGELKGYAKACRKLSDESGILREAK